jgi:hypothetical protein
MLEKAKQGIWPSQAPLGYLNTVGPHGKKIIVPDPDMGPIVSRVFEWFETGDYALKDVTQKARAEGCDIAGVNVRWALARFTTCCATVYTQARLSGQAASIRVRTSLW